MNFVVHFPNICLLTTLQKMLLIQGSVFKQRRCFSMVPPVNPVDYNQKDNPEKLRNTTRRERLFIASPLSNFALCVWVFLSNLIPEFVGASGMWTDNPSSSPKKTKSSRMYIQKKCAPLFRPWLLLLIFWQESLFCQTPDFISLNFDRQINTPTDWYTLMKPQIRG